MVAMIYRIPDTTAAASGAAIVAGGMTVMKNACRDAKSDIKTTSILAAAPGHR
jgi:hypothetical protein